MSRQTFAEELKRLLPSESDKRIRQAIMLAYGNSVTVARGVRNQLDIENRIKDGILVEGDLDITSTTSATLSGWAWVVNFAVQDGSVQTLPISAPHATFPRIDYFHGDDAGGIHYTAGLLDGLGNSIFPSIPSGHIILKKVLRNTNGTNSDIPIENAWQDAPSDNELYGRRNGQWQPIAAGNIVDNSSVFLISAGFHLPAASQNVPFPAFPIAAPNTINGQLLPIDFGQMQVGDMLTIKVLVRPNVASYAEGQYLGLRCRVGNGVPVLLALRPDPSLQPRGMFIVDIVKDSATTLRMHGQAFASSGRTLGSYSGSNPQRDFFTTITLDDLQLFHTSFELISNHPSGLNTNGTTIEALYKRIVLPYEIPGTWPVLSVTNPLDESSVLFTSPPALYWNLYFINHVPAFPIAGFTIEMEGIFAATGSDPFALTYLPIGVFNLIAHIGNAVKLNRFGIVHDAGPILNAAIPQPSFVPGQQLMLRYRLQNIESSQKSTWTYVTFAYGAQ